MEKNQYMVLNQKVRFWAVSPFPKGGGPTLCAAGGFRCQEQKGGTRVVSVAATRRLINCRAWCEN